MTGPRIYADFQNLDAENRIRLVCAGTVADLNRAGLVLTAGMQIPLYTDDEDDNGNPDPLLADGTVERNEVENCWVARVDWNRIHHQSSTSIPGARPSDSQQGRTSVEPRPAPARVHDPASPFVRR
jgi:hypothetical protein